MTGKSKSNGDEVLEMDLKEIGVDVMNWMELAQDRDHWRAHTLQ